MRAAVSYFRKITLALCVFTVIPACAQQELVKQGPWTVQPPIGCSSLPLLQVNGPGTLFDPANAGALSDLQRALIVPLTKACPGVREAILVNGRGRRLIRMESPAVPVSVATPSPGSGHAPETLRPGAMAPPQSLGAQVQPPPHPVKPEAAAAPGLVSPQGPESPFVDLVQFRNLPARRPTATEHREEHAFMTGVPGNRVDYRLDQFVPPIGRALSNKNKGDKLTLERLPNGKWIPATVWFTAQDSSFYTSGFPYLGRIIASKPSSFVVTLSENGTVTGRQTGSTDDLRGSGIGYIPTGTITWDGTETLDLNTGLDTWSFQSHLKGSYNRGLLSGVKGALTASDSVHIDLAITPGIDESRTKGDANVASDPANPRALMVGDIRFRSSTGAPALRFSDRGVLSVPLVNRAGFDLNELHYTVTTADKVEGILDPDKLSGTFAIAHDAQTQLAPVIGTNFGIPAGGVSFVITISYRNTVLARKTMSVPTEPFYRDSQVQLPDANAPRLRATAKYFGTGGAVYGDPGPELTVLAANDPLAAMWEAAFLSQGVAGYTFDRLKAYQLARHALPRLEDRARGGNAEALYLFFYACQLGLEGENARDGAGQFLDLAASSGFLPAKFDRARLLAFSNDDRNALAALNEVYAAGVKRAAFVIGRMYEQGRGVEREPQSALKWYRLGADFGDPAALLGLANLTASGFGEVQPDPAKAMQLARQAASRKFSGAYLYIGRAYLSGRQGIKQDTAEAVKALKSAADLGDRDGMLALGETYLRGTPDFTPDERAGVYWIRQAAERESPDAMLLLAKFYLDGKQVDKDPIAARYWWNQAALKGVVPGDSRGLDAQRQIFLDFWQSADFSPSYVYVNSYGNVVGDSDDGLLKGIIGGTLSAMMNYYGNQQTMIDGLEFIQKREGKKIYGGTVSSAFTSKLQLKAGQTVSIRVYGVVSSGMFSGLVNADGLGSAWPEYRIIPNFPTAAVIGRIGNSSWQMIGTRAEIPVSSDGPLSLGVNGRDFRNYKGYFDAVVEIPDEE